MKLFYSVNSPYARIVRIALIETGLDGDIEMRLLTREQLYSPESELLLVNPTGKVPSLVLPSGVVLTECREILDYVDAVSGTRLIIRDGSDQWLGIAQLGQSFALLDSAVAWLRSSTAREPSALIARERIRINRILDAVAPVACKGDRSGKITAAQIVLATALGLDVRIADWKWRDGRPNLSSWYDEIVRRPAFKMTLPQPS